VRGLGLLSRASRHSPFPAANEILRFDRAERHLHWAIAVPFTICFATALVLVTVYNPSPTRPFREAVSWIHRLSGICLAILPLRSLVRHRRDVSLHLHNMRQAWMWKLDDLKWLTLMGPAAVSHRVSLPHQGKFNAAEKINFMVLTLTLPVYIVTGLTIWFFRPAYVSWLVHFSLAALAVPLVLGHIFMATLNPDTRPGLEGMFSGFVDRRWAKHHYHLWYEENFGRGRTAGGRAAAAARAEVAPSPAQPAVAAAPSISPSEVRV
jgi:formate dehydrogenase gamma subunit